MFDGRRAIVLEERFAGWRATRGYVENVAAAIARAVVSDRASGRIYNVGDARALTERERVASLGRAARWDGEIVVVEDGQVPPFLRFQGNAAQDWVLDTSRIRQELAYEESVDLRTALERTVAWQRRHVPEAIPPDLLDYGAEDAALARRR
jgi:nucleoside-diphosphate-sugar epimerase